MKVKSVRIDVKKIMDIYSFGVGQFLRLKGPGVTVLQLVRFFVKKFFRNVLTI